MATGVVVDEKDENTELLVVGVVVDGKDENIELLAVVDGKDGNTELLVVGVDENGLNIGWDWIVLVSIFLFSSGTVENSQFTCDAGGTVLPESAIEKFPEIL